MTGLKCLLGINCLIDLINQILHTLHISIDADALILWQLRPFKLRFAIFVFLLSFATLIFLLLLFFGFLFLRLFRFFVIRWWLVSALVEQILVHLRFSLFLC